MAHLLPLVYRARGRARAGPDQANPAGKSDVDPLAIAAFPGDLEPRLEKLALPEDKPVKI